MSESPYRYYQVLRVFLACPSELVAERSRFSRVLDRVNNLAAHPLGFHLQAVGWERVLPTHGRPQELINEELRTADLVVVLFWNKIGVPSGDDPSVTGTVEEFQLAMSLRAPGEWGEENRNARPVLFVYFRKQTEPETDSAKDVREFRKTVESTK